MLHRFTIDAGRVSYGNRYLHSRNYRTAKQQGHMVYGEFATDPCRSLFSASRRCSRPARRCPTTPTFNVTRLGERFISMTETPMPVAVRSQTLQTAGVQPYEVPGQLTTAHPHMDRASRGMLNYAAKLGRTSSYRSSPSTPTEQATRDRLAAVKERPTCTPRPDRALARARRVPLVVNPLALALSGARTSELQVEAELGTRFTLVDRASGEATGGFRPTPASPSTTQRLRGRRRGRRRPVRLRRRGVIEDLYLDRLRQGKPVQSPEMTRFG